MHDWIEVGAVDPAQLANERLQLHLGAWVVGSTADSVLDARPDDSHHNLGFEDEAFRTHSLIEGGDVFLELAVESLSLQLHEGGAVQAEFPLVEQTLQSAVDWVQGLVHTRLPFEKTIRLREYPDFPGGPIVDGAPFRAGDPDQRAELGLWFGNAIAALRSVVDGVDGASPIRIWPHHFDVGSLVQLDAERSVGLGMSPGDGFCPVPYFYVYAYPHPENIVFDQLPFGEWSTGGFQGAVLRAEDILRETEQSHAVLEFLRAAYGQAREALMGGS